MSGSFSYAIWARDQYGRTATFVPPQPEFLKCEHVEMLKTGPEKRKTWRCVGENDSARGGLAPKREGRFDRDSRKRRMNIRCAIGMGMPFARKK